MPPARESLRFSLSTLGKQGGNQEGMQDSVNRECHQGVCVK
jgi:hypothetical protein